MADFLDRISPSILISTIFLLALALAGGLVWAGIKLSPIIVKEPSLEDKLQLKKNSTNGASDGSNFSNSNDNFEDALFAKKEMATNSNNNQENYYNDKENQVGSDQISGGEKKNNSNSQDVLSGNSSGTNDTVPESYQGGNNQDNGGQNISNDLSGGENNISSNSNKEIYEGSAFKANSNQNVSYLIGVGGCRYPAGDVSLWWHSATKQQQKCYISTNGQPNLNRPPYFCPYENNEDCYYR